MPTSRRRRAAVSVSALGLTLLVALAGTAGTSGASPSRPGETVATRASAAAAAAKQKATLSVLPPVSQAGKKTASTTKALSVVSGAFKPTKTSRPVVLYRRAGAGWQKVATTKMTNRGLAEWSVPTKVKGKAATYRATAQRWQGLAAITTKPVRTSQWSKPSFRDEFTGSALGSSWSHRLGFYNPYGLRNCAKGSPDAVAVTGGALQVSVIKDPARSDPCTAKRADGSLIGQFAYRLNGHIATGSAHDFTYGVAAARMKFQELRGQHASFWLQPTTLRPEATTAKAGGAEIDIIEWFGADGPGNGLASFIYHPSTKGPVKVGGNIKRATSYLSSKSDRWWTQYHVFSVEWTRKAYVFRIDGHETWRTTEGISGQPQYPIVSLLSSDYELDDLGKETNLPQHMYVDWVQIWQS
ncbi:MAG: glycoside hydrolase family 16 protein [Nocardioides sp.]